MSSDEQAVARKISDPFYFYKEILGLGRLWKGLEDIIISVRDNRKTSVSSGHAVGKDFISGFLALWFLYAYRPSIVITTAPTDRQVSKIIWGEIRRKYKSSRIHLGGRIMEKDLVLRDDWFATGFTTKETHQTIGRFQGFHSPNMLVIVSEAQAVEDQIFEQLDGILTGEFVRILYIGNPLSASGAFRASFNDPTFRKIYLSCLDHPNVVKGRTCIPGAVSKEWVEEKKKKWGEDSPLYVSRVLGKFPDVSNDTLCSIQSYEEVVEGKDSQRGLYALGVDVARYGDDETVLTECEGSRQKKVSTYTGKSIAETAGLIIGEDKERKKLDKRRWDTIVVDDAGVGGGVTDLLFEAQDAGDLDRIVILPMIVGKPAFERNKFGNLRAEIYWRLRDLITQKKIILLPDEEQKCQVCNTKYKFNSRGQIMIESKEDMRKRGVASPDRADALVLALYGSIFSYSEDSSEEDSSEEDFDFDKMFMETIDKESGLVGQPIY